MASPETSLRQRGRKKNDHSAAPPTASVHVAAKAGAVSNANKPTAPASEWDYKLALAIVTILAFITRFWKIYDPESVVFDEVHFGKVCAHQAVINAWTDSYSSPPITFVDPTSLMSIPHLRSCFLPVLAGLSDTMATTCSKTLVNPILKIGCHMSHFVLCPPLWGHLLFRRCF